MILVPGLTLALFTITVIWCLPMIEPVLCHQIALVFDESILHLESAMICFWTTFKVATRSYGSRNQALQSPRQVAAYRSNEGSIIVPKYFLILDVPVDKPSKEQ